MKFFVVLAVLGCVSCQTPFKGRVDVNKFQGKYVYDLLKPALNAAEAVAIETSKDAGAYPTYNSIPDSKFDCSSKAGPGFYADVDTQCQVFHRCDLQGNVTDYLCVNTTVFNQITLICDKWYNVDCAKSLEYETFANSRLYTDKPLFDTPPADYVAPSQQIAATVNVAQSSSAKPAAAKPAAGGKANKKVSAGGSAKSSGRSDEAVPSNDISATAAPDASASTAAPDAGAAASTAAPDATDAGSTAAAADAGAGGDTTAAADAGAAAETTAAPSRK